MHIHQYMCVCISFSTAYRSKIPSQIVPTLCLPLSLRRQSLVLLVPQLEHIAYGISLGDMVAWL